jgi:hypothetical protein
MSTQPGESNVEVGRQEPPEGRDASVPPEQRKAARKRRKEERWWVRTVEAQVRQQRKLERQVGYLYSITDAAQQLLRAGRLINHLQNKLKSWRRRSARQHRVIKVLRDDLRRATALPQRTQPEPPIQSEAPEPGANSVEPRCKQCNGPMRDHYQGHSGWFCNEARTIKADFAAAEPRAPTPPEPIIEGDRWYTRDEIYHYLRRVNYAHDVADELAGWIADQLERAYRKGQQMATPERTAPEQPVARETNRWKQERIKCDHCDNEATCVGRYEKGTDPAFACDVCCGHGNEDGVCFDLNSADEMADLFESGYPRSGDAARAPTRSQPQKYPCCAVCGTARAQTFVVCSECVARPNSGDAALRAAAQAMVNFYTYLADDEGAGPEYFACTHCEMPVAECKCAFLAPLRRALRTADSTLAEPERLCACGCGLVMIGWQVHHSDNPATGTMWPGENTSDNTSGTTNADSVHNPNTQVEL